MKNGVTPFPELRPAIGAMDIDHDIGRIEQNDQVLREIGQCIHLQILVRQQHRSSFGNTAAGAHYRMIDMGQNPGIRCRRQIELATDLRRCRADQPAVLEQRPDAVARRLQDPE